jgi:poly(3-hydroxybutyrate) depolymerase
VLVAGASDATVPYAGGKVPNWGTKRRGYVAGVEEFFTFWQTQNGCTSTVLATPSATVSEARGTDCRSGSPVVRYRITGGGHEWFRAPKFDTTSVVWDFVARRFASTV